MEEVRFSGLTSGDSGLEANSKLLANFNLLYKEIDDLKAQLSALTESLKLEIDASTVVSGGGAVSIVCAPNIVTARRSDKDAVVNVRLAVTCNGTLVYPGDTDEGENFMISMGETMNPLSLFQNVITDKGKIATVETKTELDGSIYFQVTIQHNMQDDGTFTFYVKKGGVIYQQIIPIYIFDPISDDVESDNTIQAIHISGETEINAIGDYASVDIDYAKIGTSGGTQGQLIANYGEVNYFTSKAFDADYLTSKRLIAKELAVTSAATIVDLTASGGTLIEVAVSSSTIGDSVIQDSTITDTEANFINGHNYSLSAVTISGGTMTGHGSHLDINYATLGRCNFTQGNIDDTYAEITGGTFTGSSIDVGSGLLVVENSNATISTWYGGLKIGYDSSCGYGVWQRYSDTNYSVQWSTPNKMNVYHYVCNQDDYDTTWYIMFNDLSSNYLICGDGRKHELGVHIPVTQALQGRCIYFIECCHCMYLHFLCYDTGGTERVKGVFWDGEWTASTKKETVTYVKGKASYTGYLAEIDGAGGVMAVFYDGYWYVTRMI